MTLDMRQIRLGVGGGGGSSIVIEFLRRPICELLRRRHCCTSWRIPYRRGRGLFESFSSDRKWWTRGSRGALASFKSLVPEVRDLSVIPSLWFGKHKLDRSQSQSLG